MRIDHPHVTQLIDLPLGVGEGPLWSEAERALYFIDIRAPALFRLDPSDGGLRRWTMPSAIGSFGLCVDGRAIVALRDGVHYFDFATEVLTLIAPLEADCPTNRLNDGKVAPDGRFFVGSMDTRAEKEAVAALYCVHPDGRTTRVLEDLIVSNGLAWSPDGRTMFHSDSRGRYIQAFDYDLATGRISNGRRIAELKEDDGRPDGAACDAEGFYWSAGVSAGCLNRFAPDGRIDRKVILPVPAPTMPCFGGPDLKTLFVTSLTTSRTGNEVAGTIIAFPVDVPGAPVARFGEPLALRRADTRLPS